MDDDLSLKLMLYQQAVQHPEAELALLFRMYTHHHEAGEPTRFREDFAGSAALAAKFVSMDENHRALAVEIDPAVAAFARQQANQLYPDRADDLHVIADDVLKVHQPKVDLTCALNFSTFIYHSRDELLRYFRVARRSLRRGGIFVLDLFGGPGAQRIMTQQRKFIAALPCDSEQSVSDHQVTYTWQQHAFDAATSRIECRISFTLNDGKILSDAFVYDWRLWSPPEVRELLHNAGFGDITLWCDRFDPQSGQSDGDYQPVESLPAREDWIVYFSAKR